MGELDRHIFCVGIPGSQAHRTEGELVAGLCAECEEKLITTKSWSSASPVLHNSNKGRGSGIILPGTPVFKSPKKPEPRMPKGEGL